MFKTWFLYELIESFTVDESLAENSSLCLFGIDILFCINSFTVSVLVLFVKVSDPCKFVLGGLDIRLVDDHVVVRVAKMQSNVFALARVSVLELDVRMDVESLLCVMFLCDD